MVGWTGVDVDTSPTHYAEVVSDCLWWPAQRYTSNTFSSRQLRRCGSINGSGLGVSAVWNQRLGDGGPDFPQMGPACSLGSNWLERPRTPHSPARSTIYAVFDAVAVSAADASLASCERQTEPSDAVPETSAEPVWFQLANDSIEGTGFVLHVTVERRIGDVDQFRHTRAVGCFVTLNRRSERSKARCRPQSSACSESTSHSPQVAIDAVVVGTRFSEIKCPGHCRILGSVSRGSPQSSHS